MFLIRRQEHYELVEGNIPLLANSDFDPSRYVNGCRCTKYNI